MSATTAFPTLSSRDGARSVPRLHHLMRAGSTGPLILLFAHVPLALLMARFGLVAKAHALGTIAIGFLWVLSGKSLRRAAYLGAYITGAEVLWRMTGAVFFWEFGKYATVLIFVAAIVTRGRVKAHLPATAYFVLLLPSVFLTVSENTWEAARRAISFNLSGPLALMICVWLFSNVELSQEQLHRLFLILAGPILGVASLGLFSTLAASSIRFGKQAIKVTSGGFGPNQVSAALGFGVLVMLLFLLGSRAGLKAKLPAFGVMLLLAAQAALTFSRGGLILAAVSGFIASLYLLKDSRTRARVIILGVCLFVALNFILLPRLDQFTGGALTARFESADATGRDNIVKADLKIWMENPVLGAGPGQALTLREKYYRYIASHTEFTRLLAEHGILGLGAILLLLVMAVQALIRAHPGMGKAVAVSMLSWSFFFMTIDGMRLVAPAFAFGLCFASIISETRRASRRVGREQKREDVPRAYRPAFEGRP